MNWRMVSNLVILATLWGSAFPFIKLGLESFAPGSLSLLRFLVASLCFIPILLLRKERFFPASKDLPTFIFAGFVGISVYHTALNVAELHVSAGAASLLIATAPVMTAIVAMVILGEQLKARAWLGSAISFLGVVFIVLGDSRGLHFNPYALLVLLSAFSAAIFTVAQKPLFASYSAVAVTAFCTWAGTLPLVIFAPGLLHELPHASLKALGAGVYIGIFPAAIAYLQFSYVLSKMPASVATTFLYSVPAFSMFFSWLLLGEIPSLLTLGGGAVAIFGIVLVNFARRPRAAPLS